VVAAALMTIAEDGDVEHGILQRRGSATNAEYRMSK